jgi:hypothetical protein
LVLMIIFIYLKKLFVRHVVLDVRHARHSDESPADPPMIGWHGLSVYSIRSVPMGFP